MIQTDIGETPLITERVKQFLERVSRRQKRLPSPSPSRTPIFRSVGIKFVRTLSVTGPFLAAAVFARERAAARHAASRSGRELSRPAKVPARIHGRRCGMFRKWRLPSSLWPVTRAIGQAMSRVESLNLSETSLQFTCTRALCDLNPLKMRIVSVQRSKGKSISIYFVVLIRKQFSN